MFLEICGAKGLVPKVVTTLSAHLKDKKKPAAALAISPLSSHKRTTFLVFRGR